MSNHGIDCQCIICQTLTTAEKDRAERDLAISQRDACHEGLKAEQGLRAFATRERDEAIALGANIQRQREAAERERDEAVSLLRAIWHGEGSDKWPDPVEFRKRVEALVGPPPPCRNYTNRSNEES